MADFKEIHDLLVKKAKVRGNPVAITLFRDTIPEAYEPIQDTPCAIVRYAMDEGRKVYFDADHHDCLVGVHHAGITPGKQEIVSGEYLSKTSNFFTYEGAARLKAGTPVLPTGMVKAIGAAPLNQVPDGVPVDWIIAVCNAHHASTIGGCRMARDGIKPYASFGASLCGEIFAAPWHYNNVVVTSGDFGGRMNNRIKQDQLFVVIPSQYIDALPALLLDMKVDVKESRKMTKPAHSAFWQKLEKGTADDKTEPEVPGSEGAAAAAEGLYTMPWTDEAKKLMEKVPEGIHEMVIQNSEDFAREKGYAEVSKNSMNEQMALMGTSIDEMLESI